MMPGDEYEDDEPDEPPFARCDDPSAHRPHWWRHPSRGIFECDGYGYEAES